MRGGQERFGRSGAKWVSDITNEEVASLAAAYLQHRCAVAVNRRLGSRAGGISRLAEALGESPETTRKKLRGHTRAQLSDLLGWAMVVGADVLADWPDSGDAFFPDELAMLAGDWRPGTGAVPSMERVDVENVPWGRLADSALQRLLSPTLGSPAAHLIDRHVIRHSLVVGLRELHMPPDVLWTTTEIGSEEFDLVVGLPTRAVLRVVYLGPRQLDNPELADEAFQSVPSALRSLGSVDSIPQRLLLIASSVAAPVERVRDLLTIHAAKDAPNQFELPLGAWHRLTREGGKGGVDTRGIEVSGRLLLESDYGHCRALLLRIEKVTTP